MNQHDLIYVSRAERCLINNLHRRKQWNKLPNFQRWMLAGWVFKKNTDHYKIKIMRMLHLWKIYKDTTQSNLLESQEQLLFSDKTEVSASQRNGITIPKSDQPFLGPWLLQGVSLKLPGSDPRVERFFSDINQSRKGSGGKSETRRTLMILKSLIILAFQIYNQKSWHKKEQVMNTYHILDTYFLTIYRSIAGNSNLNKFLLIKQSSRYFSHRHFVTLPSVQEHYKQH